MWCGLGWEDKYAAWRPCWRSIILSLLLWPIFPLQLWIYQKVLQAMRIVSRLVPHKKKANLCNCPKWTRAGGGKCFSLCLPAACVMGFTVSDWSVEDYVTTAMISACSVSEATTHLMQRDKQDLTDCRCLLWRYDLHGCKAAWLCLFQ